MKLGYGFKSRSHRVVQDSSVVEVPEVEVEIDELKHSSSNCCWGNMPQELLREVLVRIEASESDWPLRRSVVACGGVCRSWREIMKEVVRTPEASGKLTFPISVKQPGPREPLSPVFYKTEPHWLIMGSFFLLLVSLGAPPAQTTTYLCMPGDMSKGSSTYVGRLRSNFLGTKFIIYDGLPPHAGAKMTKRFSTSFVGSRQVSPRIPAGNYPVAHISYELNVLGSRGPRRMNCTMDAIPASAIEPGVTTPRSLVNDKLTAKPCLCIVDCQLK
ncbi:hypothetical protein Vadar_000862 [Vaccinium darrowii]|uniref:Uncharacterized protein n=1 Tax=Vaccinium darrowii TaxID=229202 RepID=A0ACB7XMB0_9ERIC|nr:hypothetical protein Vadar_000862 [Vaccinium darrowii]